MPSCENGDHIYGHEGVCVFCKQPRPYEPGLAQFDDTWKAILSDPHIANLRQKSSLHEIRRIIMHTSAPFARQQSALADQIAAQSAEIARLREVITTARRVAGYEDWDADEVVSVLDRALAHPLGAAAEGEG